MGAKIKDTVRMNTTFDFFFNNGTLFDNESI